MQTDIILNRDCLEALRELPENSVHCCVTSPPYYALRDYGMDGQIGREDTPEDYVARLTSVFREVRRVLTPDGTCWLNIGDTYCGKGNQGDAIDPKYPNGRTGQVVALKKMLDEPHECAAVLQQIAAIRGAVNGLMREVIKGHLTEHIVHQGDELKREEDLDVVLKVLDSYIK